MRALAYGLLAVLTVGVGIASGASRSAVRIGVNPLSGPPSTHFVITFRAPAASGPSHGTNRRYELLVSGPHHSGCASSQSDPVTATYAGQRIRVSLGPGSGRRWCAGAFNGRLEETETPVCARGQVCPLFIALIPLGKFSFRVASRGNGARAT